jgi:hypothetical protein
MARPSYKFSELIDLLIVMLYEADRQQENPSFVSLDALAQQIKGEIPSEWVFDAAKVLQSRMLADCTFNSMGTYAKISGEGRLYVEEGRGITREAQQSPANFYVTVNGDNSNILVAQNATDVRQANASEDQTPVGKVLNEIQKRIQEDPKLTQDARSEALDYAALIRKETKKAEPNRTLVAVVLDSLSKIASIAGNVATLMKYLNA